MHDTTATTGTPSTTGAPRRIRRSLGRKAAAAGFALAMAATPGVVAAPAANAQPVGMSINMNPDDWAAGAGSIFGSAGMIGQFLQDPAGSVSGLGETGELIVGCIIASSSDGPLPMECQW